MAGRGAAAGTCAGSSSSSGSRGGRPGVWSYTPATSVGNGTPRPVVLQSIRHARLRSIALLPSVVEAPTVRWPQQQQQQLVPPRAADQQVGGLVLLRHQHRQNLQSPQEQQLEQLMGLQTAEQQQQQGGFEPLPWVRLVAAARQRQRLPAAEKAVLLQQLQQLLPLLSAARLAQAAWAASALLGGPSLAAGPHWQQQLLAAAGQHFAAGTMHDVGAAKLLQALVKLGAQPSPAWLAAACEGMAVGGWGSPKALSTVAACLPQLGHVPSSTWAQDFFAASTASLAAFPAISLARTLHGVVAWRHLQQQQQQQQQQSLPQELVVPQEWLCRVMQLLHACSAGLAPPEVAMVLQALQRLQQQSQCESMASSSRQGGCSRVLPLPGQQAGSQLQLAGQQLLDALLPAVLRQLHSFGSQDLAVVLFSLAQLQAHDERQAGTQGLEQPCCSWLWVHQVLTAAQEGLLTTDARTQVTTLWAAATLIKPHLVQQQPQQQQQQQQQHLLQELQLQHKEQHQQPVMDTASVAGSAAGVGAGAAPAGAAPQQQVVVLGWGRPVLVRPLRPAPAPAASAAVADAADAQAAVADHDSRSRRRSSSSSGGSGMQEAAAQPLSAADADAVLAAAPVSAAAVWLRWVDAFLAASLPLLPSFSCQDLVEASWTLASHQLVPSTAWYQGLLGAVTQSLPAMAPGQVAGLAWALAQMALLPCRDNPRASLVPLQPWLARLYAHTGLPLATAPGGGSGAGVGGAAAAADVDSSGSSSSRGCSPSELVRLMWAAGVCDHDPGDAWWAAAEQQLLAGAAAPTTGTTSTPTSSTHEQQHDTPAWQQAVLPTRLLGALVQAYVACRRSLPPAMQLLVLQDDAAAVQLPQEPLVNTLRLLRALVRARISVPGHWLQQLAAGFQGRLGQLAPAELPQLLCCLADAGLSVQHLDSPHSGNAGANSSTSSTSTNSSGASSAWLLDCFRACEQLLARMGARDASLMLRAAAKLRLRLPPALLAGLLLRLQAGYREASPAVLAQAVDALARLGAAPSSDWLGGFLMATHRCFSAAAAAAASAVLLDPAASIASRLALASAITQTLSGLSRLGVGLPPKWLKAQLLLLHVQLPLLRPAHISGVLLALARLKCRPSAAYLDALLTRLGDCAGCSVLDLVHVVYACACLSWRPSATWVRILLAATGARLSELDPRGLALLHWGLSVSRVVPPQPWRRAAVAAVAAHMHDLDARQLSMITSAWGRMRVHLTPLPAEHDHWRQRQQQQQQQRQQEAREVQHLQHFEEEAGWGQPAEQLARAGALVAGAAGGAAHVGASGSSDDVRGVRRARRARGGANRARWPYAQRQRVADQLLACAWQLRGQYTGPALVHLLVGVARMRLAPSQDWLHGMVARGSCDTLSVLDGYLLQQLVWALAHLGYQAQPAWLQAVGVLLETRWQQHDATRHSAAWALQVLQEQAAATPQQQHAA